MRGHFDDYIGGLHDRDGEYAGFELEVVGCFTAHQRHDAVGAAWMST
jgi:hypothetical protein